LFSGEAELAIEFSDLRCFLVFCLHSGSDSRFRFEGFDILESNSGEPLGPLASAIAGDKALDVEERLFFFFFVTSTWEGFGVSGTARLQMSVPYRANIKCFHQPVSPKSSGISGNGSG
jgi:hypothetical protein